MVISNIICPKKTLTSQKWIRRNDSTSVSTLLQPDCTYKNYKNNKQALLEEESYTGTDSEDEQPRRVILSEPQSGTPQHKIHKTFCPDCYCKSFPVAPCMGKPRDSCCCQQTQTQNTTKTRTKTAQTQNYSPQIHSKTERCQTAGRYTKRRENYETKSKDYFTTLKQRLEELEKELKHEQEDIKRKQDEYKCLQERTQRKEREKCCQTKPQQTKIKDIMSFRKTNFFACHSSTATLENPRIDEKQKATACYHSKCLHKCYLNENLKLTAENPDEYGTSRCLHCRKSLSAETLSHPPSINSRSLLFEKSSLKNLNLIPVEDETSTTDELLQDKMFLTTRNNEQLEVTLPHNFLHEVQKPALSMLQTKTYKNFKVPIPADSMALRYQKGMINRS